MPGSMWAPIRQLQCRFVPFSPYPGRQLHSIPIYIGQQCRVICVRKFSSYRHPDECLHISSILSNLILYSYINRGALSLEDVGCRVICDGDFHNVTVVIVSSSLLPSSLDLIISNVEGLPQSHVASASTLERDQNALCLFQHYLFYHLKSFLHIFIAYNAKAALPRLPSSTRLDLEQLLSSYELHSSGLKTL